MEEQACQLVLAGSPIVLIGIVGQVAHAMG